MNRRVGDSSYQKKSAAYAQSVYAVTQDVATRAPHEWRIAQVEDRQNRMADRALHIWRADFL